jgi:hypothetical protein
MKRVFALGVGLIVSGIATAGEPAPPPRAATLGMPLSSAVASVLPTPSIPSTGYVAESAPSSCAPGAACQSAGRPCLQRIWSWLTYQPGPPVLPVFVPKPYRTPIRGYFPCIGCNAVGGCNPIFGHAAGCAAPIAQPGGILPGNTRLGRWGVMAKQAAPSATEPASAASHPPGYRFATPNYPAGGAIEPAGPVPAGYTRPAVTQPLTKQ